MSEHFPGGLSNAVYIMVRDFPGLLFCIGDAVLLEASRAAIRSSSLISGVSSSVITASPSPTACEIGCHISNIPFAKGVVNRTYVIILNPHSFPQ